MIRRHPFVFGNSSSEELDQAFETWEKRKRIEKNRQYLLSGVPRSLPSLLLACIIQKKVSSNGLEEVFFQKVSQRMYEGKSAIFLTQKTNEPENSARVLFFSL